MRKSTKRAIIGSTIFIIVLGSALSGLYYTKVKKLEDEYAQKVYQIEKELADKKKQVYVSTKKIKVGEVINDSNVSVSTWYSDRDSTQFIEPSDLGKRALVDIPKGSAVLHSMIKNKNVDSTAREQEFTQLNLSSNLVKGDLVDVRIVYPNGESYVVLSQKTLNSLAEGKNGCYMTLNAEELDLVQSSFVDAYVNKAMLYTVRYVQESLEDGSIPNYTPSKQVAQLIEKDPNIKQVSSNYLSEYTRTTLEDRLESFRKELSKKQLEEKQQEKESLEIKGERSGTGEEIESEVQVESSEQNSGGDDIG